jgi:hypothetical protein
MTEQFSLLKTISTLTEDGEGAVADAGGDATPSPAAGATTAGMIAPVPVRMFNGKVIKRVKRNYFPKKKKSHK